MRRGRAAVCTLLVLWAASCPAAAQQPATGGYRVYGLQHVHVAQIEGQLRTMLAGLGEPTQLMADPEGNRFHLTGSARAHQLAEQLIRSLDAAPTAPTHGPMMRAYAVGDADPAQLAAALSAAYPNRPDVRIAADPRTRQVLVMAPPADQEQIAMRLSGRSEVPAPNSTAARASMSPSTPNQPLAQMPQAAQTMAPATDLEVKRVTLSRLKAADIETTLQKLWDQRMVQRATQSGQVRAYEVELSDGELLELQIHDPNNQVIARGPASAVDDCLGLIQALDRTVNRPGEVTQVVPISVERQAQVHQALDAVLHGGAMMARAAGRLAMSAMLAQQQPEAAQPSETQPEQAPGMGQAAAIGVASELGLLGSVQIEQIGDTLIIRGSAQDVERVMRLIEEIENLPAPVVLAYPLQHVGSQQLADLITPLYTGALAQGIGQVSITALVKPNSILIIGQQENVDAVVELIKKLDTPVDPADQYRVFPLRYHSAAAVAIPIQEFFADRTGLDTQLQVTVDVRSNSIIVRASPRDLVEVGDLIATLDRPDSGNAENEMRIIYLKHTLPEELAPILQEAVSAQTTTTTTGAGGAGGGFGAAGALGGAGAAGQSTAAQQLQLMLQKSFKVNFVTIDEQGEKRYSSGILSDVRITAAAQTNALIISAPKEGIDLLEALIDQLDQPPNATVQVKVFTITNGDAASLVDLLENLFGVTTTGGGGFGGQAQAPQLTVGENALVSLRFSVDLRTNSIIATGSSGDLDVVEAILTRLDESDVRQRTTQVFRLKNSYAVDVANAINTYLQSERAVQQIAEGAISPFQQIEQEVVVVAEAVTNSLIVSTTPRYFEEIKDLVDQLDARPPMVMVQALIAEVALNNTDEFGVELGLQDSVLFDRSLLGDLVTQTVSTQQAVPGGGTITATTTNIVGASNTPGYNFNNQPLGNSGSDASRANGNRVGGQALSNFSVGRMNGDLGFGGLVLSAGSESVNILIRALQESRRVEVLSRPQIMTLDNQQSYVQVGERVPRITGATITDAGAQQTTVGELVDLGIILGMTPRVSPDGLVVMLIDVEKSEVGPEIEGIPVAISQGGQVVRSPRFNVKLLQTTVSVLDGQTVVLGGLLSTAESTTNRRVPLLADIPVLGNLFRYDSVARERTELLIILTPHIVENEEDAEIIKQQESARMSWCLADVRKMYGEVGLRGRGDDFGDGEVITVYPDMDPTGEGVEHPAVEPAPMPTPAPPDSSRLEWQNHPSAPVMLPPAGDGPYRQGTGSGPGMQYQQPNPAFNSRYTPVPPSAPGGQGVAPANYQAPGPSSPAGYPDYRQPAPAGPAQVAPAAYYGPPPPASGPPNQPPTAMAGEAYAPPPDIFRR